MGSRYRHISTKRVEAEDTTTKTLNAGVTTINDLRVNTFDSINDARLNEPFNRMFIIAGTQALHLNRLCEYCDLVLASTPVVFYPLNEAASATVAVDHSVNSHDAAYVLHTASGSAQPYANLPGAHTLGASAADDGRMVQLPNPGGAITIDMTTGAAVEIWMDARPFANANTRQGLFALDGAEHLSVFTVMQGGDPRIGAGARSGAAEMGPFSPAVGQWTHVVVNFIDQTDFEIYLNGALWHSASSNSAPASVDLRLARFFNDDSGVLPHRDGGEFSCVAVYDAPLPLQTILNHNAAGRGLLA